MGDQSEFQSVERKLDLIVKDERHRWTNSVIYYEIGSGFPSTMIDTIRSAAWIWTQNSPIRFIESSQAENRIKMISVDRSQSPCKSIIGQSAGTQMMHLNSGLCSHGNVLHEFAHAIGLHHEHNRPDRDDYVTMASSLASSAAHLHLYALATPDEFLYGKYDYDYGSIMHYSTTLTLDGETHRLFNPMKDKFKKFMSRYPNELPGQVIGQRSHLSSLDKQVLYSYLTTCFDDSSSDTDSTVQWVAAPWGGCNLQCDGTSYRERLVSCRQGGECKPDSACQQIQKPRTRKSCELAPGNLEVTFDETQLWRIGSMMQNVPFYDQFDWMLWSDESDSESSNGAYLLFSADLPTTQGDQAWFESPIIGTSNAQPCQVSFEYLIAGGGKLVVEAVSCSECSKKQAVWTSRSHKKGWNSGTVTIPVFPNDQVKLRFIGEHGAKKGNIGLDNIIFSEHCIRPDLRDIDVYELNNYTENSMAFPYSLKVWCAYTNNQKGLDILKLMRWIQFGAAAILIICFGSFVKVVISRHLRRRKRVLESIPEKFEIFQSACSVPEPPKFHHNKLHQGRALDYVVESPVSLSATFSKYSHSVRESITVFSSRSGTCDMIDRFSDVMSPAFQCLPIRRESIFDAFSSSSEREREPSNSSERKRESSISSLSSSNTSKNSYGSEDINPIVTFVPAI